MPDTVDTAVGGTHELDLEALGRIGVALASETRRRILARLMTGPGHPAELAEQLGVSRTNVSNHLACLRGCGLVNVTPDGRRMRYELSDPRLADGLRRLSSVLLSVDPQHHHLGTTG
jgi:DNA-binding transcriptional ArsR family regulator